MTRSLAREPEVLRSSSGWAGSSSATLSPGCCHTIQRDPAVTGSAAPVTASLAATPSRPGGTGRRRRPARPGPHTPTGGAEAGLWPRVEPLSRRRCSGPDCRQILRRTGCGAYSAPSGLAGRWVGPRPARGACRSRLNASQLPARGGLASSSVPRGAGTATGEMGQRCRSPPRWRAPVESLSASLRFEHCVAALDRSLAVGAHGLPLIGSGDWNDGMNRVGYLGRGESVWLGWFLYTCLLYTSDAADEEDSVDLGGRRIIKKKKK